MLTYHNIASMLTIQTFAKALYTSSIHFQNLLTSMCVIPSEYIVCMNIPSVREHKRFDKIGYINSLLVLIKQDCNCPLSCVVSKSNSSLGFSFAAIKHAMYLRLINSMHSSISRSYICPFSCQITTL